MYELDPKDNIFADQSKSAYIADKLADQKLQ